MNSMKSLSYNDILLKHGYGVLASRKDADITVNIGGKT